MSRPEHRFHVQIRRVDPGSSGHAWAVDVAGVGHTQGYTLPDAKRQAREMIAASQEIDYNLLDLTFEVRLQDRLYATAESVLRSRGYDDYPDYQELFDEMLQELSEALVKAVEDK